MARLSTRTSTRLSAFGIPVLLAAGLLPGTTAIAHRSTVSPVAAHRPSPTSTGHHRQDRLRIRTLSMRADLVSGGEVLTRVGLPRDAAPRRLHVSLNGHDVSRWFRLRRDHHVDGLLRGLRLGRNRVIARVAGERSQLVVTNHPIGGPVFSGPQIRPWHCPAGSRDAKCDQHSYYTYKYLPVGTNGVSAGITGVANLTAFLPYDPKRPPPSALIARTTTMTGVRLPFVVRVEHGYIDRDQYQIAALIQLGKPWQPWAPQPQFNHRLVITHGASCDTAYGAGAAPSVLDPKILGAGFVVMSNALDNAGHNCNLVTEAEALVMTKQRVIDHYGPVEWTIGMGCSGGSLAQQQVANAYPGIYQGVTPQCSFTDAWSSAMEYVDYSILLKYFENPTRWSVGTLWTPTAIQAVIDHPNVTNPVTFTSVIPNSADPSRSCPDVPGAQVYNPKTNPRGVKCTLQDYMVNVFGKRKDGFANRPFGNDGIQYGLQGLLDGQLTPGQFVDLNSHVGGLTYTDEFRAARSRPDLIGVRRAYRSGAVDSANNLDKVAIIDLRGPDPGLFHDVYRTYAMRARLLQDFGTAANQVLWRGLAPLIGDLTFSDRAVFAMDRWLARVHADHRHVGLAKKIIADRPPGLTDRCTDGAGTDLPAEVCDETVSAYGTPRMAAGMPIADNILECRLQPLRRSDYPVKFSQVQWQQLEATFPRGVCNYNVKGVGQRPTVPWLTYQRPNGHVIYGGKPLGPPPKSRMLPLRH